VTLSWLAWAVAAGMAFFLVKSRWNFLRLPSLPVRAGNPPDVTVVIPARNEEGRIGRAVSSFPGVRVVVVDDASADGTAADALGAGAEVIPAPPLAGGWLGKPNACWAGARTADSRWLLFVDADTRYRPEFLSAAVGYAEREKLDVLTVFLDQERVSAAEKLLLPYAFALYFTGVSARAVNSPVGHEALANGQCVLFRREAYFALGGHAAVAGSVIEDVALARLARRHGLGLRVVRGEKLGSVRMYENLRAIWQGFEKNSFRFLQANPASGIQVVAASILLTSYLPVLWLAAAGGNWAAAAVVAALPSLLLAPWYGGLAPALGAPLAIYLFQAIALSSMARALTGAKAVWKGRRV
jgi:cellulose synthase/poly-beta-1,6-N-acetylglucosamine synthase-like glycosyltransferase